MHDPGRMSDVTLLLTLLSTVLPMLSAAGDAYASEEKAHEKPPRFAYATLMVGAADKQERVRLWEPDAPHNLNVFNRTLCFQQRLHALGARHPLVVIHNFDFDEKESKAMAAQFDQMHKVVPSDESVTRRSAALLSAEVHLHKFAVWALTEWDRIIYIDSDVRIAGLDPPTSGIRPIPAAPLAVHAHSTRGRWIDTALLRSTCACCQSSSSPCRCRCRLRLWPRCQIPTSTEPTPPSTRDCSCCDPTAPSSASCLPCSSTPTLMFASSMTVSSAQCGAPTRRG